MGKPASSGRGDPETEHRGDKKVKAHSDKESRPRTDPVLNFERWKKKHIRKQKKMKELRKQLKKPEWQVERETIGRLTMEYEKINVNEIMRFSDFPLSRKTLKGLQEAQYRMVTEIQKQTIGLALQGKDVLGAAKTGSGKTLAFLVPVLETLYRLQWTSADGLGVLIISPTRELAYQTFEVLRKVGKNHDFSAGLIIGGKDLKHESERINQINILICTPGRLLQHMDETTYFHATNLQMLVLDEADRILDMGFADTMNAIIENLPKKRQTLLFSATQTKSVKDLARLSLKDPAYVWVHEKAKYSTPATLDQNYVICELHQKISVLYSFLKSHLKKKSIVFFASCKEVQYLFRVFCRLRPGISILALHGKQQQMRRMEVYNEFVRKKSAVLFATDIAARGLDFPAVNWVLQFDCPEDANTYIHRAGRTARYKEGGESLLILLPSEVKGMVHQLSQRKVPVKEIKINPEKLIDIQKKLEAFLAQDQDLKERAQRCFVSYLRSIYLMKNKEVFDVNKLLLPEYALSLGLAVAQRVRFLQRIQKTMTNESLINQTDENKDGRKHVTSSLTNDEVEEFRAYFNEKMSILQKGEKKSGEKDKQNLANALDKEENGEEEKELEEEIRQKNVEKVKESEVQALSATNETSKDKVISVQSLDGDEEDEDGHDADFFRVKRHNVFGLDLKETTIQKKSSNSSIKKKATKVTEAKKVMKRKFKVNTKVTFTEDGEEKRLKEKESKREARKKQVKAQDEEEEAFLDWSDDNSEFDPSTLPDPDKPRSHEQTSDDDMEDEEGETRKMGGVKKRNRNAGKEEMISSHKSKKAKWENVEPLDTGLSLAEDEELVLHLLKSQS
uniref:ATP-dependent RNA helicase n=1 Tax=Monodelphis domestica TaxID=13616 RepID=A0A5F8H090_MONDO